MTMKTFDRRTRALVRGEIERLGITRTIMNLELYRSFCKQIREWMNVNPKNNLGNISTYKNSIYPTKLTINKENVDSSTSMLGIDF